MTVNCSRYTKEKSWLKTCLSVSNLEQRKTVGEKAPKELWKHFSEQTVHFYRRGKTTDVYSEEVRQKTSAQVNTLLTSALVMVSIHSSAFLLTVNDNIAQLLAESRNYIRPKYCSSKCDITLLFTKAVSKARAAANSVSSAAALERPQSLPKPYIYHVRASTSLYLFQLCYTVPEILISSPTQTKQTAPKSSSGWLHNQCLQTSDSAN